jgi:transcription elongation factor Elf1
MGERHEIFEVTELEVISFECPTCGTEIAFKASTSTEIGTPQHCPACNENLRSFSLAVKLYRDFFQNVTEGKKRIRLRTRPLPRDVRIIDKS